MKSAAKLLIVDDEEIALRNLERAMKKAGYEVVTANSGSEALTLIRNTEFDLLLTDLRMEKVDGMQLLGECRRMRPQAEVIMITSFATAESAVEAMKQGAFYYIAKPFRLEEVRKVVSEALEKIRLRRENQSLREQIETYQGKTRVITQNAAMQKLLDLTRQIAPTDCGVLITGESGTGKELFARSLHQFSTRCDGPYITVNCGAFNDELLANELFGHEKEAFTGAMTRKKGLIEAASGGTLFLDEITETSPAMQVKLLRAIQEKEILRMGATAPIKVDFRVVAATNRDIAELAKSGAFRQDLYFRLNVVTLRIPPLAQRKDDIPLLAHHFLRLFAAQMNKPVTGISPEVQNILAAYSYPGNVRELKNIIERGVAVCNGNIIESAHLPEEMQESPIASYAREGEIIPTLDELEIKYIRWV
jgi:DNA-binding NtrC family response regulator